MSELVWQGWRDSYEDGAEPMYLNYAVRPDGSVTIAIEHAGTSMGYTLTPSQLGFIYDASQREAKRHQAAEREAQGDE